MFKLTVSPPLFCASFSGIWPGNQRWCTATGENGRGLIIRQATPESADFIYTYFGNKKYVGVHCVKFGHMYLTNREHLKKCFGEENLEKIYKFINE